MRTHANADAPADGAEEKAPSQSEPFEKVLDEKKPAPAADEPSPATPNREASAPGAPAAPKAKKAGAKDSAPTVDTAADPELPLPQIAVPAPLEARRPERMRPDALPLPGSVDAVPAGTALVPQLVATNESEPAGEALPAVASDLVKLVAPERAEAPQALTPETRLEVARTLEAKPAPAPLPPPAESARASEILRQMRVQLSPELRSATIQLSPPELGRISIRLRVERGELSAVVRAEKRETLAALQRHVPELEATLGQLGIRAREIDLQLGFEQKGARQGPNEAPNGAAGAGHEHEPRAREHERRLHQSLSARVGGIDTYA